MTSLCALFSMRWTDVALEDALLCGIPHQFPLHHWLVKILRLELGIGAEAGHLPELLPPRRLLVKVLAYLILPVSSSTVSHKRATVIFFWVRVPVLSEQMTLVEPKVSTPSRFFIVASLQLSKEGQVEKEDLFLRWSLPPKICPFNSCQPNI